MKDSNIDWNLMSFVLAISVAALAVIFTLARSADVEAENFAKNMETAMSKGVDPIAVKCAYDKARSDVCITYVLTHK